MWTWFSASRSPAVAISSYVVCRLAGCRSEGSRPTFRRRPSEARACGDPRRRRYRSRAPGSPASRGESGCAHAIMGAAGGVRREDAERGLGWRLGEACQGRRPAGRARRLRAGHAFPPPRSSPPQMQTSGRAPSAVVDGRGARRRRAVRSARAFFQPRRARSRRAARLA
jgi:hypothetical protein